MTEPFICQDLEDCNSMPWDEVDDERRRKDLAHEYEYFEQSSIDGAPSDEWRRIGQARRKFLLEQDCQKGGTLFDLNTSCDVDRYFQVANRALEQFYRMYHDGSDLEDTYVMGHRMVCFLTESLPTHPGFHRPAVSDLRRQCFMELEQLHNCLEEISLKIDEDQCDRFADDFDPLVDSDSEGDDVDSDSDIWAGYRDIKGGRRLDQSPTSTVNTTGSASLDSMDSSSSDDDIPQQRIIFMDTETELLEQPSILVDLSTDFLDTIAEEEVEYEVDSEATDSWVQGADNESYTPSISSSQGIKCDPARIPLQAMFSRGSKIRMLPPAKREISYTWVSTQEKQSVSTLRRKYLSPTRSDECPNRCDVDSLMNEEKFQNVLPQDARESAVVHEIQKFLDASFEYDPSRVFDSSMEEFSKVRKSNGITHQISMPNPHRLPNDMESTSIYNSGRWLNVDTPRSYRLQTTQSKK